MRLITKSRDTFTPGDKNKLSEHIANLLGKNIKVASLQRRLGLDRKTGLCVQQNGKAHRVMVKDAVFDRETGAVKQLSWMWAK